MANIQIVRNPDFIPADKQGQRIEVWIPPKPLPAGWTPPDNAGNQKPANYPRVETDEEYA